MPSGVKRKPSGSVKSGVTAPGRLAKSAVARSKWCPPVGAGVLPGKTKLLLLAPWLARIVVPAVNCWLLNVVNNSMYCTVPSALE